jgi:hypothetical protein
LQDNPFADSTLYDVNTTYVPPDLNETVDAVVPAIPVQTAAAQSPVVARHQPPAVPFPIPASVPAVPAAPLAFTGARHSIV